MTGSADTPPRRVRKSSLMEADAYAARHLARALHLLMIFGVESSLDQDDLDAACHLALSLVQATRRLSDDFEDLNAVGAYAYAAGRIVPSETGRQ